MNTSTLFPLKCGVQHYQWGAREHNGREPYIAELLNLQSNSEPFAELWLGAHPKLPASVVSENRKETPLSEVIAVAPRDILGSGLVDQNIKTLPFLLKVLDCESPLSIQAHPDKSMAEKLHTKDPEHYPDDNHKPEIAVGVKGMEAFCQFRPAENIKQDLKRLNSLAEYFADFLAAESDAKPNAEWLQNIYSCLFQLPQTQVEHLIDQLVKELGQLEDIKNNDRWFLSLLEQYPGDRGTLNAYFLNIINLKPEEAVFLAAGEPHAYLQGTIIECMANSDNVVRAGLTSKFVDTQALVNMLTYRDAEPQTMQGETAQDTGNKVYKVPAPEFQLEIYKHDRNYSDTFPSDGLVSLMIVLEGSATLTDEHNTFDAPRGSAWVWPAAVKSCSITCRDDNTKIVRARPNLDFFGE